MVGMSDCFLCVFPTHSGQTLYPGFLGSGNSLKIELFKAEGSMNSLFQAAWHRLMVFSSSASWRPSSCLPDIQSSLWVKKKKKWWGKEEQVQRIWLNLRSNPGGWCLQLLNVVSLFFSRVSHNFLSLPWTKALYFWIFFWALFLQLQVRQKRMDPDYKIVCTLGSKFVKKYLHRKNTT